LFLKKIDLIAVTAYSAGKEKVIEHAQQIKPDICFFGQLDIDGPEIYIEPVSRNQFR